MVTPALLLAASVPLSSLAQTINVDFNGTDGTLGTYSGTAAAPDSGTTWNGFAVGPEAGSPLNGTTTSGALVTSAGAPTPVTVSLGNFRFYEANENPAGLAPGLLSDFVYQQTLGPGGPDSTFSINHLDPSLTYDLYLYAQNGGYSNTSTVFMINGASKIATNVGDIPTLIEDTNYVVYRGLAPNSSGTISGTFNDFAAANNAAFNGLQILQIPEPTGLSLLAFGGMLALRRRRCG